MPSNSLNLEIRQRQQQTLTPMQIQFVRLLEMNGPEVEQAVQHALDDNPALECAEPREDAPGSEDFNESAEQMQLADYRSPDDVPDGADHGYASYGSQVAPPLEAVVSTDDDTLYESLVKQLRELPLDDADRDVALYVAGNIDDNGYLTRAADSLADDMTIATGVETSPEQVRRAIAVIRSLEPAGIGAVDLRDCLKLQLQRRNDDDASALALEIVTHYFDVFSKMHFDKLRAMVDASPEQFDAALERIRTLNPKPGALVAGGDNERMRQITPDFIVEPVDGDASSRQFTVSLPNRIPALRVEQTFRVDPQGSARGIATAAAFVKQKREDAQTFIKVLEMRQNTLLNVMTAIVRLQPDFFASEDVNTLKPMVLKDIGELTGLDLSVISRATAGKYVATQRAIYPLRFFFSERSGEGSDTSSHVIREALKSLVAAEDRNSPLSDSQLTQLLNEKGYPIARRTVAKYREKLGIPVGRLRKL